MSKRTIYLGVVLALGLGVFGYFAGTAQSRPARQDQATSPVSNLGLHLVGVHVIKEAPDRQYVAHHYCQELQEDLIQCAVFDSGAPGARLIDVEYVVGDEAYRSFSPEEQQQYWHPHDYEVDGGLLQAPELPPEQARALLSKIRNTHGRTWHLWAAKEDPYPLGKPELVWSITGPGQLREEIERQLEQGRR